MAIVYAAVLTPSKLDLLAGWLPTRGWYEGGPGALELVGAFRFDDPDGAVGLQDLLVRSGPGSPIYQVPLTYRDAPLAGAEDALLGEMDHSVLGRRWVYDACHDPVFVAELVRAALTGGTEAVEVRHTDDAEPVVVPATMHARGSGGTTATVPLLGPLDVASDGGAGSATRMSTGSVEIELRRRLDGRPAPTDAATLTGSWGEGESQCLAAVRVVDGSDVSR